MTVSRPSSFHIVIVALATAVCSAHDSIQYAAEYDYDSIDYTILDQARKPYYYLPDQPPCPEGFSGAVVAAGCTSVAWCANGMLKFQTTCGHEKLFDDDCLCCKSIEEYSCPTESLLKQLEDHVTDTYMPSDSPTAQTSAGPSSSPSSAPSSQPPSARPSSSPTLKASEAPSPDPSGRPSSLPSLQSLDPSSQPSETPSARPSSLPTLKASEAPSRNLSGRPSSLPSLNSSPSKTPVVVTATPTTSIPTAAPITPTSSPISITSPPSSPKKVETSGQDEEYWNTGITKSTTCPSGHTGLYPINNCKSYIICAQGYQITTDPFDCNDGTLFDVATQQCIKAYSGFVCGAENDIGGGGIEPRVKTSTPTDAPTYIPTTTPTAKPVGDVAWWKEGETDAEDFAFVCPPSYTGFAPTADCRATNICRAGKFLMKVDCPDGTLYNANTRKCEKWYRGFVCVGSTLLATRAQATPVPTPVPTSLPTTLEPSGVPTGAPSSTEPSQRPSSGPSESPSSAPSSDPSSSPSSLPSLDRSSEPSETPSARPSSLPTLKASDAPSGDPSGRPSSLPSQQPSTGPSESPSSAPSSDPSSEPSSLPSLDPSSQPSETPSSRPSSSPTLKASEAPSRNLSGRPSSLPSLNSSPSKTPVVVTAIPTTSIPTAAPITPTSSPISITSPPSSPKKVEASGQDEEYWNTGITKSTTCPSGHIGLYPINNCKSYIICAQGYQIATDPFDCNDGTLFDVATQQCIKAYRGFVCGAENDIGGGGIEPRVKTSTPTDAPTYSPTTTPTAKPVRNVAWWKEGETDAEDFTFACPPSYTGFAPTADCRATNICRAGKFLMKVDCPDGTLYDANTRKCEKWYRGFVCVGSTLLATRAQATPVPTPVPTSLPTTLEPSGVPTGAPSSNPSDSPTLVPTSKPSEPLEVEDAPQSSPSSDPSSIPSSLPSLDRSSEPSETPSETPSSLPSLQPSGSPSESHTCPDGFTGLAPAQDCKGFNVCRNGKCLTSRDCQVGTLFDTNAQSCQKWNSAFACGAAISTRVEVTSAPTYMPSSVPTSKPVQQIVISTQKGAICPSGGYEGLVPSSDCTGSNYCRNGEVLVGPIPCPDGHLFDPNEKRCVTWHKGFVCCAATATRVQTTSSPTDMPTAKPVQDASESDGICPDSYRGMIPSADCRSYNWCSNGEVIMGPLPCPDGTLFDTSTSQCEKWNRAFICGAATAIRVQATSAPTSAPTDMPSKYPTAKPSKSPTAKPVQEITSSVCAPGYTGLTPTPDCKASNYCVDGEFWMGPMNCPDDTLFDVNIMRCTAWNRAFVCGTVNATVPTTRAPTSAPTAKPVEEFVPACPRGFTGLVPTSADCTSSNFCMSGKYNKGPLPCPNNMLFDFSRQSCTFPDDDFKCQYYLLAGQGQ